MSQHELYLKDGTATLDRAVAPLCGREQLVLHIAGLDFAIGGLSPAQLARARSEYEQVIAAAPSKEPFELSVREARPAWFRSVDLTGGEYRVAISYDAEGTWASGLHFFARLERAPRPRMTLWVEPGTLDGFEGALINALRVLVAHGLLSRGGLVFHSAAIESHGRAFMFFGPSGAGKSTLSHLSAETGRAVISDELNALVPAESGFEVLALPFAGDFGRTVVRRPAVPLGGVFRLKQAKTHALAELPKATALATLLAACPYVNADPHTSDRVLDLVQRLVEAWRPRELSFALDAGFWSLVDSPEVVRP